MIFDLLDCVEPVNSQTFEVHCETYQMTPKLSEVVERPLFNFVYTLWVSKGFFEILKVETHVLNIF